MLILTANQNQAFRLSASRRYPRAHIQAFDLWVRENFQKKFPELRALNSFEQEMRWQKIVRQFSSATLVSPEALASLAEEAWWLCRHWDLSFEALEQSYRENTRWFLKLAKQFEKICEKDRCVDEATALRLLTVFSQEYSEEVYVHGFFELTPLQRSLFQEIKLLPKEGAQAPGEAQGFLFESFEEELDAALTWALLEKEKNPEQKIAVILPELGKRRGLVASLLFEKGAQEAMISLPPRLSEQGIVQTAFSLLKEHFSPTFSLDVLASLLRSPFWGEPNIDRPKFLLALRALQLAEFDLDVLLKVSEPWPLLQKDLNKLYALPKSKPLSVAAWMEFIKSFLSELHFSFEEPIWKRFTEVLEERLFSHLSSEEKFSIHEFLDLLKRFAQKTYLEEKAPQNSMLVLGIMDALDQSFDQVWLVDVVQGKIPFSLSVNPLIDRRIQREKGFWAINTDLQDHWTEEAFRQLRAASSVFRLSYSSEEEGQLNLPAYALMTWQPWKNQAQDLAEEAPKKIERAPLFPWAQSSIPGASGALKAQRICAMQAFGRFRLGLEPLPEPSLGLTPIERGFIVHRALQLIWQRLQNQQALLAISFEQQDELIDKVLPLALKATDWLRRKLLPKALWQLEAAMLKERLKAWLSLEAERPPFEVLEIEKEFQTSFKGYQWRLRVDRIDRLEDGRLLLIDYKTGRVSIKNWQPEIFTEPQLPLYVVTSAKPMAGMAFAEVMADRPRMSGIAESNLSLGAMGSLKGVEDWGLLVDQWRDALEKLIDDFTKTDPILNPFEGALSCEHCGLQGFCRVFE